MADLYILSKAQVQDHSRITKYLKSTVQAERLAWKIFGVRKSSKFNVSLVSSSWDGKEKSDCLPRKDVQQPAQQDQVRACPGK